MNIVIIDKQPAQEVTNPREVKKFFEWTDEKFAKLIKQREEIQALNDPRKLSEFDYWHPRVADKQQIQQLKTQFEQVGFVDAIKQLRDEFCIGMVDAKQVLARADGNLLIAQIALRGGWSAFIEAEKFSFRIQRQGEQIDTLERENAELKTQLEQGAGQHFGYGLVDKNGQPHPEMYTNKSYAIEEAERFTETYEDDAPYRVVELRWVEVQP